MPPAKGVMPFALSVSQALSSCDHVCGALTPAFCNTSLRYRTGNEGWTYHGAVQTLPPKVSSFAFR